MTLLLSQKETELATLQVSRNSRPFICLFALVRFIITVVLSSYYIYLFSLSKLPPAFKGYTNGCKHRVIPCLNGVRMLVPLSCIIASSFEHSRAVLWGLGVPLGGLGFGVKWLIGKLKLSAIWQAMEYFDMASMPLQCQIPVIVWSLTCFSAINLHTAATSSTRVG